MVAKMYEVDEVARMCEIAVIATTFKESGRIDYEVDDLHDFYETIVEPIYTEWANQTVVFRSREEASYITEYANRILLERYGTKN
ncbi:hypothetical protein P4T70_25885 [Bacillus mobilis]|uniref:hypothetical protein n=1 Tax=Bacillus mobilis TaxID=2026190 RepID=UPI002E1AB1F1|nr:hypothetical protein [Bacillus mobilis]